MSRFLGRYIKEEGGAIAAVYALSLFGLVAMAGVGWDYGRMMAMDSELQNAADQAALAAATQLNGRAGAIDRAEAAARTYLASAESDFVNITRMANDGGGRPITDLTFAFYEDYNSTDDTFGDATAVDAAAKVVHVTVNGREAFFALTPIVGLISSGDIVADAVAGLESAVCNVPPLMFCAPSGDDNFPSASDVGSALSLRQRVSSEGGPSEDNDPGSGSEDLTPGNFDLLNIPYSNLDPNDRNRSLGLNSEFLGCTGSQTQTRPGAVTPQTYAINTRFDIYRNPLACDSSNGDFCPSDVVRSNLVRRVTVNTGGGNGGGNNGGGNNGGGSNGGGNGGGNTAPTCANTSGGELIPMSAVPAGINVTPQAFTLDSCQLTGACGSFGDGIWNVDQYLQNVHGINSTAATGIDANNDGSITRFEVYNWERSPSFASRREVREFGRVVETSPNRTTLYCSHPTPQFGTARPATSTQKDRRVVTVASVDCSGILNGRVDITSTIRWVDLFLIAPSDESGGYSNIYAEVVGPARLANGGTGFQNFGRNKPVLLR